ncbi:PREDICTED: CD63 antigen-like [Polistes canadensis]|uniref:CD63 antigen-like n=1 Tax=Polistes canadensis TaxID=91411 RepID=UPI000718BA04|nr:PREDICTED: CD63 antigen-like [Polistes canadensis]
MAATHLDVGLRCIKYLLCAVNSLFVLTGIMIISVGSTIYAVYEDFSHFLDPKYFSPATLLIVVGILVFIIAFFGCCGALRESTCMVLVFAVSLSVVLVMELSAATAAYALQDTVKDLLESKINTTMHEYDMNKETKDAVDFMQSRLHCCGYNGRNNWDEIKFDQENDKGIPNSCCGILEFDLNTTMCKIPYEIGCMSRLSIIVHRSALYIGTGAVAIALIQLTGIVFACMLGRAIRRQKTERERRKWELRESIVNGYQPLGKADPLTTFPVVYMQSPDYPLKSTANC